MSKRCAAAFIAFCFVFMTLYFKLVYISTSDTYVKTANEQSSYTLSLPTDRGTIYDANFNKLVNTKEEYTCAVLPTAENILKLFNLTADDINSDELIKLAEKGKPFSLRVTKEISEDNIITFKSYDRYPEKLIAPHVIGYTDSSTGEGLTGIEKAYNDYLTLEGENTVRYTLDGIGRAFDDIEPTVTKSESSDKGVVLTIDKNIQTICEQVGSELIGKGAIVVMECSTGKLRAVCSFPEYTFDTLAKDVSDEENSPMINRAFTATAIGSTFKIVTTACALTQGINVDEEYDCTGSIEVDGTVFKCHNLSGHGLQDIKAGLMNSCNTYFINLSQKLDVKTFLNIASDMSFGKQYQLAPGLYTAKGILPDESEILASGDMANLSFGQGKLTATPVQIAQMISCVVNGGVTPVPMLIEGETSDGKTLINKPQEVTGIRAISESTAEKIKGYLVSCVMENEGQNALPELDFAGVPITTAGGKTATAQTGVYKDGKELCNGWFAGFFPAENPIYTIVILKEEATSGNVDASPVFSKIVSRMCALG